MNTILSVKSSPELVEGSLPLVESRKKWTRTRKTIREAALSSFHLVINNPLFTKSLLQSLIMLFKLPFSLPASFPTLYQLKWSGMSSRRMGFPLLSRRSALFSRGIIERIVSNLPSIMKTGLWKVGRWSYGQMRPRSTGLNQMAGSIPRKKGAHPFQIALLPQLSSMEEEIISWYGAVWAGMGLGSL
jgi:hypothetical protein